MGLFLRDLFETEEDIIDRNIHGNLELSFKTLSSSLSLSVSFSFSLSLSLCEAEEAEQGNKMENTSISLTFISENTLSDIFLQKQLKEKYHYIIHKNIIDLELNNYKKNTCGYCDKWR